MKNVLKPNMKKNKTLYNVLMNIIVFIVGSFIFYQIAVHLNKLNDYHVNKDMKYFFVICGSVSILLRYAWIELFEDNRPKMEDEMVEYMLRDAERVQRRYEEIIKEEKKKRFDNFKFLK